MRGRVAKALRRTGTSDEKPGDREIVQRMAARRAHVLSLEPRPLRERDRKRSGAHGPQGYSAEQMAAFKTKPTIVIKPVRKIALIALEAKVKVNGYFRFMTEGLLKDKDSAGRQPKWMLDRLSVMALPT